MTTLTLQINSDTAGLATLRTHLTELQKIVSEGSALTRGVAALGQEITRLKVKELEAQQSAQKLAAELAKLDQKTDTLAASTKKLADDQGKLKSALVATEPTIKKHSAATDSLKTSQTGLNTEISKGLSVQKDFHGALRGTAGALGGLWLSYGAVIPMAIAFANATGLIKSAKLGASFEYELAFIKGISGETTQSIQGLRDELLKASTAGSLFSPVEQAKGVRVLVQAGFDAKESLAALPSVLNLAAAGEISVAEAAQVAQTAMNAFRLGAQDIPHIVDSIAKAAAISATDVGEMSAAFTNAAQVGELYGASVDEVNAQLATLAQRHLVGSAAGTALTNMYRDMGGRTEEASRKIKALGIDVNDAQGNMKPMIPLLGEIQTRLSGFTEAARASILKEWQNLRGLKSMVVLLGEANQFLPRAYLQVLQSSNRGEGFAQQVVDELKASTQGALKVALGQFEGAFIESFYNVREEVKGLVQSFSQMAASAGFRQLINSVVSGSVSAVSFLVEHKDAVISLLKAYIALKVGMLVGGAIFAAVQGVQTLTAAYRALTVAVTSYRTASAAAATVSAASTAGLGASVMLGGASQTLALTTQAMSVAALRAAYPALTKVALDWGLTALKVGGWTAGLTTTFALMSDETRGKLANLFSMAIDGFGRLGTAIVDFGSVLAKSEAWKQLGWIADKLGSGLAMAIAGIADAGPMLAMLSRKDRAEAQYDIAQARKDKAMEKGLTWSDKDEQDLKRKALELDIVNDLAEGYLKYGSALSKVNAIRKEGEKEVPEDVATNLALFREEAAAREERLRVNDMTLEQVKQETITETERQRVVSSLKTFQSEVAAAKAKARGDELEATRQFNAVKGAMAEEEYKATLRGIQRELDIGLANAQRNREGSKTGTNNTIESLETKLEQIKSKGLAGAGSSTGDYDKDVKNAKEALLELAQLRAGAGPLDISQEGPIRELGKLLGTTLAEAQAGSHEAYMKKYFQEVKFLDPRYAAQLQAETEQLVAEASKHPEANPAAVRAASEARNAAVIQAQKDKVSRAVESEVNALSKEARGEGAGIVTDMKLPSEFQAKVEAIRAAYDEQIQYHATSTEVMAKLEEEKQKDIFKATVSTNDAIRKNREWVLQEMGAMDDNYYSWRQQKLEEDLQRVREAGGDEILYRKMVEDTIINEQREGARKRAHLEDDTLKGFMHGWEDYKESIGNSYDQIRDISTKTFKSLEDSIVEFVKTGKFEFKSLIAMMIEELIRFQVRAAMTPAFNATAALATAAMGAVVGSFSWPTSVGASASGQPPTGKLLSQPAAYAEGGWLNEPIFGVGRSGQKYTLGENESELVIPKSKLPAFTPKMGGGAPQIVETVNQVINIDARGADSGVEQRLQKISKEILAAAHSQAVIDMRSRGALYKFAPGGSG